MSRAVVELQAGVFFYFFGCTQVGLTTTNSNSITTAINTMTTSITIRMCITLGQGCPFATISDVYHLPEHLFPARTSSTQLSESSWMDTIMKIPDRPVC